MSIIAALALTGRNPYLSTAQKIVQARVYAQGLTLAVIVATAVFEIGDKGSGEGRWETVKVLDPDDPKHQRLIEKQVHKEKYEGEDQWLDMIEAEEAKMKEREEHLHEREREHEKQKKKGSHKEGKGNGNGGSEKKDAEKKEQKAGGNEQEKAGKGGDKK